MKPHGVPASDLDAIELQLDELEAIRLGDMDGLYQEEAAAEMGISRATFGRLIGQARRKVANALVNGKMIILKGGTVMMMNKRNFVCAQCGNRFSAPS